MVAEKEMCQDILSLVAEELRVLYKPCFKSSSWLISMGNYVEEGVVSARGSVEQLIEKARAEIKKMELLSPFFEGLNTNIEEKERIINQERAARELERR